jgi:1-acyl-sn-glycerol-3-phosphate acyltransferase
VDTRPADGLERRGGAPAAADRDRFRPTRVGSLQARLSRRAVLWIGRALFRLRLELAGLEHVPRDEPVIVAAAPHRNWIDSFLIIMALPPVPRVIFLGSAEGVFNRWWKRAILSLMGGVVPVSTRGQLNREALETSLAILAGGNRLGIFPEGWDQTGASPVEVQPLKRGVAFLSARSGCRVMPVGIAGTKELWRGKTLRLRIGPPLEPLAAGADRNEEQAYVERLHVAISAVLPPLPPAPADGRKPWSWLTRMLG